MDLEKLIDELDGTDLADLIRERFMTSIIADFRADQHYNPHASEEDREADRAWRNDVADYLEENYS
jgi:hypothetical protein